MLLQISRKIWRFRVVTLPVLALTLLGAFYVVALKEPEYEATTSYVLINPPPPPTPEQIATDPRLGRISPDNPFTRFDDQSVIVNLLASSMSNESARRALAQQGADPRYTVAPTGTFGYSSLIMEITGVGSTPESAIETAKLVGAALTRELDRMQASRGVADLYRIRTQLVVAPDHAEQRVSGKLRTLVGVFTLGAILLFMVVSAAEGLTEVRAERRREAVAGETVAGETDEGEATVKPRMNGSQGNGGRGNRRKAGSKRRRRNVRKAGSKA